MPYGTRDGRVGTGAPDTSLKQPTATIPCDCSCSWTVYQAGPGMQAMSKLRYINQLCPHVREHEERRLQQPSEPHWPGVA